MNDLKQYTKRHTDDLDTFFKEKMQDPNYRAGFETEKTKLASAAAILEAREAAGLSQQKLADQSGVPKTTIARIEKGNNTSIETLTKIANALGKTVTVALI